MAYVTKILSLFTVFASFVLGAQQQPDYKIGLKDYHASEITASVLTEDENYFISADASGKVIMFNAHTFDYIKTLRKGYDIPINSMFLSSGDSVLVMSQRYEIGSLETDSLIELNLYNDNKRALLYSYKFTDAYKNDVVIAEVTTNNGNQVGLFGRNLKDMMSLNLPWNNDKTAVSTDNKLVAFSTKLGDFIKIKEVSTGQELTSFQFPKSYHVMHIFFDAGEFFALLVDMDANVLKAVKINADSNIENPLFSMEYNAFYNAKITHKKEGQKLTMLINQTQNVGGLYLPLKLVKTGDSFKSEYIQVEGTPVGDALQLKHDDKIIFFDAYDVNRTNVVGFSVFDNASKKFVTEYPENKQSFYEGLFLPGNNWMVSGSEITSSSWGLASFDNHIKYYTSGTFENRFGALKLSDYIEVEFGLKITPLREFHFNKANGVHAFYASKKGDTSLEWAFYAYDFISNKVKTITNYKPKHIQIQDYNAAKNLLLLSNDVFFNRGYTESIKLSLIKNDKELDVAGDFKFGRFSQNGEYLLTINKADVLEIRTVKDLKVFYTKQLEKGAFTIHALDTASFVVANSHYSIKQDVCNSESFTLNIDNQKVNEVHLDCMNVLDATFSNNKLAFVVEHFGVVFTDKVLKFTKGEFPKNISFNEDASKFMLTLSNGKIVVHDAVTLKPIGGMVHPGKDQHVFYTYDNYYFANIDASQFLYATKEDVSIPLTETESVSFRPDKVLEMFGEVDQKYLEALNKALQLRQQHAVSMTSNTTTVSKENSSQADLGKSDLYFLSIGVSDYQDNIFDLTYADKDAIDMANFYGKLDKETLDEYKTKFFGKKFKIYQENQVIASMNNYYEGYASPGMKFVPVNKEATKWLEIGYEHSFIWDFNAKTIVAFEFPESIKSSTYSISEDNIMVDPDNQGFFVLDYDNSYFFNFKTAKLENVIKFETKKPITGKRWLNFTVQDSIAQINYGSLKNAQIESTKAFNLLKYKDAITKENKTLEIYEIYPQFFTASLDGNMAVYTSNEDVFVVDVTENNPVPLKISLPITINYGDVGYVDNRERTLSVLSKNYDENSIHLKTFSFEGEMLGSEKIELSYTYAVVDNKFIELRIEAPMVESNQYLSNDSLIENTQAFSFDKVFLKTLTDSEATKENIKEQLKNFLSKADANDQVMVFLAGHGVLDKDLNYYFAPHDMDFTEVSKNGLSFQELIAGFDGSQSANKLLLMDSCHSGNTLDLIENNTVANTHDPSGNNRGSVGVEAVNKSDYKVSSIVKTLFNDFLSKSGVTVISAASGGDLAQEGTSTQKFKGNGAFTYAYLQVLKDNFSGIFMNEEKMKQSLPLTQEFVNELMKQVMLLTDGKQVPDLREINTSAEIKIW